MPTFRRRAVVLGFVSAIVGACAHHQPPRVAAAVPEPRLPNGLYALLAEAPTGAPPPPGTGGPTGRTFFHDRRKIDPTTDAAPTYVTIDAADFVPLILERRPEAVTQPDGRIRLQIALAREQVEPLAAFTRKHVGGRAAVVLDGQIITVHKVRTVIDDGHLQISRCTDRACERIYAKLVEDR
jgi:hypothetical protein